MEHHAQDKKKVLGITALIGVLMVTMLTLAFPAQAYDPDRTPTPAQSTSAPSDHHHPAQPIVGEPAPFSALEQSSITCSGGIAGEYACQGIDFMSRVPL